MAFKMGHTSSSIEVMPENFITEGKGEIEKISPLSSPFPFSSFQKPLDDIFTM